jgi:hypothetical protein
MPRDHRPNKHGGLKGRQSTPPPVILRQQSTPSRGSAAFQFTGILRAGREKGATHFSQWKGTELKFERPLLRAAALVAASG